MATKIKELFDKAEGGTLTYEQFEALVKECGAKFADLSDGGYVSKSKYEADIKAKDTEIADRDGQIETLNGTITTRDTDLAGLQKQLEEAGQDATKLAELSTQFSGLQQKYEDDVKNYQAQMQKQAYEFAVKEFASTKNFSSQAAKRDFVKSMIERNLEMENGKILGRDDFAEAYSAENADAFVVEVAEPITQPEPEPTPAPSPAVPEFVASTPGPSPDDAGNAFNFGFTGVRAH